MRRLLAALGPGLLLSLATHVQAAERGPTPPAPADEPLAATFSLAACARFLDAAGALDAEPQVRHLPYERPLPDGPPGPLRRS